MTQTIELAALAAVLPNIQDRAAVEQSWQQHVRNGRGFWPMVETQEGRKIIAFRARGACANDRWTVEEGKIDVLDLHQLSVTDWPRVRMACH